MRTFVEIKGKVGIVRETSGGKKLGYRKQVLKNGRHFPALSKPPLKSLQAIRQLPVPW
jgi:hypothetical protein